MLIDSILIGLPIPNTMLAKYKKSEKFIVVDGQQRLKSIYFYIKGEFNDNGTIRPFKLRGLDGRKLDDKLFTDLDEVLQRRIYNTVINSTILDNIDSKPKIVFEIFNRLNTGGVPLTNQEVRNCIFSGQLNKDLKELNKYNHWRNLLKKDRPDKRLNDLELIQRFISLSGDKYKSYDQPMREWLNEEMKKEMENPLSDEFVRVFKETIKLILDKIGVGAFTGKGRYFNRAIFDAVMIGVYNNLLVGKQLNNIKTIYNRLLEDKTFQNYIIEGTTDKKKVKGRIELAVNYFGE